MKIHIFTHSNSWPRNIRWTLSQLIKSSLVPGIATLAFVYLLAYALAEWCCQA